MVEFALYQRTGENPAADVAEETAGKGEATHSSAADSKPVRRGQGGVC